MTAIEIIDSAVKIGLGALISGITTYLVTKKNHVHELTKLSLDDKKSLIREISTKLEDGTSDLNRCIYQFRKENEAAVDLSLMLESKNAINRATALAAISGNIHLFDEIQKYSLSIGKLYEYLTDEGESCEVDEANILVKELNSHWVNIHPLLSDAYKDIWTN